MDFNGEGSGNVPSEIVLDIFELIMRDTGGRL